MEEKSGGSVGSVKGKGPGVIPERFISLATVAQRLDRTVRTVQRWQKRFGLPRYCFGRSSLYDWEEVVVVMRARRLCARSGACRMNCRECRAEREQQPGDTRKDLGTS
jgi:hypothetical protein